MADIPPEADILSELDNEQFPLPADAPTQTDDDTPSVTATPPGATYISVAIDPVALVISECITVTSAMRKNARWAQSSVSAILGGGGSGYGSSGHVTPVPASPTAGLARRGPLQELGGEIGLAGRWGLRGKPGKSIQVYGSTGDDVWRWC